MAAGRTGRVAAATMLSVRRCGGAAWTGGGVADGVLSAARRRELYGHLKPRPGLWPRAWFAPAIASGRLPSLMVEVVPSRVPMVLLLLVPAPLLRRADPSLRCCGETAWKLQVRVGAGWWSVWWRAPMRLRWRLGSGEIPVGLVDTVAVAPAGAARPSWRASGLPFLSPRRVPGETLSSSVVIVASLLGGVDWYRRLGV